MARLVWFARAENPPHPTKKKRNRLRGSPKFPAGISKRKIVFHLLFLPVPGPAPIVKLVPDSL